MYRQLGIEQDVGTAGPMLVSLAAAKDAPIYPDERNRPPRLMYNHIPGQAIPRSHYRANTGANPSCRTGTDRSHDRVP